MALPMTATGSLPRATLRTKARMYLAVLPTAELAKVLLTKMKKCVAALPTAELARVFLTKFAP